MTDPAFEPAPKPRIGLWVAVAAIAVLALVGGGALLATRSADTPTAEPSATPTAEPTSTPAPITPEEQAAADLETLVRNYRAAEDKVYLDPALEPSAVFDFYLRWPASESEIARVLGFRRGGNTVDSRGTEVHSVQVAALDLAAAPATATVVECKTLTAAGADGDGQPQSGTVPRKQVVWTAQTIPTGGWRLYDFDATAGKNSC